MVRHRLSQPLAYNKVMPTFCRSTCKSNYQIIGVIDAGDKQAYLSKKVFILNRIQGLKIEPSTTINLSADGLGPLYPNPRKKKFIKSWNLEINQFTFWKR